MDTDRIDMDRDGFAAAAFAEEKETGETPRFKKKVGGTTYEVHVYFSTTSGETLNEKIMRLIQTDARG